MVSHAVFRSANSAQYLLVRSRSIATGACLSSERTWARPTDHVLNLLTLHDTHVLGSVSDGINRDCVMCVVRMNVACSMCIYNVLFLCVFLDDDLSLFIF